MSCSPKYCQLMAPHILDKLKAWKEQNSSSITALVNSNPLDTRMINWICNLVWRRLDVLGKYSFQFILFFEELYALTQMNLCHILRVYLIESVISFLQQSGNIYSEDFYCSSKVILSSQHYSHQTVHKPSYLWGAFSLNPYYAIYHNCVTNV